MSISHGFTSHSQALSQALKQQLGQGHLTCKTTIFENYIRVAFQLSGACIPPGFLPDIPSVTGLESILLSVKFLSFEQSHNFTTICLSLWNLCNRLSLPKYNQAAVLSSQILEGTYTRDELVISSLSTPEIFKDFFVSIYSTY